MAIAHAVAPRVDVIAEHEPGDQEWVRFVGQDSYRGLLSVYFPLAIVTSELVAPLRVEAPDLTIVQITDYDAEEMRASPDILASTLLFRQPAADFDPEAITADDLFFESL